MPNPISHTQLRPNQDIFIAGKVSWSHIASLIEGDELQRRIQASTHPQFATTVPHTAITINSARVLPANPSAMTLEEQYIQGRMYQAKNTEAYPGMSFSIENKSSRLPLVMRKGDPAKGEVPNELYQVFPKYEIDRGTDVILVVHTFESSFGPVGVGLNAVIVRDSKVPYFVPGAAGTNIIANALASRNLVGHFAASDDIEYEATGDEAAQMAAQTVSPAAMPAMAAIPEPPAPAPAVPDLGAYPNYNTGITLDSIL